MEEILILENGERRQALLSELEEKLLSAMNAIDRILGDDDAMLRVFLLTASQQDGGHSYQGLIEEFKDDERGDVERALDKLLDVGLLTARWEEVKGEENKWERRFYNRGEVSSQFENFSRYAKGDYLVQTSKLQLLDNWLELSERLSGLSGFTKEVSDKIINYFAHIAEILDPDHLIIKGYFKKPLAYEELWKALSKIKEDIPGGGIYESDIRYYHPDKKKIVIYNLPCHTWIRTNIGIDNSNFQCKMRFIFSLNDNAEATEFQIIPIVNPVIKGGNPKTCPHDLDYKFCNSRYSSIYDDICIDCVLFTVIKHITSSFIKEYFLANNVIKNYGPSIDEYKWDYFRRKYPDIWDSLDEHLSHILVKHAEVERIDKAQQERAPQTKNLKMPRFLRDEIQDIEKDLGNVLLNKMGNYAKKNRFTILVLLLRKGYAFVKHYAFVPTYKIGNINIEFEKVLREDYNFEDIISDKEFEFEFELKRAKKDGKLKKWYNKKIIIFDDAINEGKHIKQILRFLNEHEDFKPLLQNIKIGAYMVNKEHLGALKAKLKEEYGKELIEDTLIGQKS